ncbi:sensor histidine kinase [Thalassospira marina]|uniref:histidine kinase n=1 Tax=Thalassospira marina TaxID=2048283 RepID=A0ABM6QG44_9PROT|nr:ATP-binding protein [Thalassospira marina]AUG55543.1 two-component sensor histidine kinase [Thalassospira marina]
MRGRLFWKILVGFAITFVGIAEGIWLLFQFYGHPPTPYLIGYLSATVPGYVEMASRAAERGGEPALKQLVEDWPRAERERLTYRVIPAAIAQKAQSDATGNVAPTEQELAEWSEKTGSPTRRLTPAQLREGYIAAHQAWETGSITRNVQSADGQWLQLQFDAADIVAQLPRDRHLNIPMPMIIAGVTGGLIFSAFLAWYLTRPILQLRKGFEQLSAGEMSHRLRPKMGRRRDEIADLARDFDHMAGRLQQLIGARDRLLNDVSHELRSPLARMQMAVALARQKPERVESSFDRIEKETIRLDELVGGLLTLSRVESGAAHQPVHLDLDHLLGRVISDARFEAEGLGINVKADLVVRWDHFGAVPVVLGNAELLRRAFENVIRNALHHTHAGQLVEIAASANYDRQFFDITIADRGPGIAPDMLETVFDPFTRDAGAAGQKGETGEEGTKGGVTAVSQGIAGNTGNDGFIASKSGFGLGLSIAKRAIEAHGGSINARNRDDGGLVMHITLPFILRLDGESDA